MAMRYEAPAGGSWIEKGFQLLMNYDGTKTKVTKQNERRRREKRREEDKRRKRGEEKFSNIFVKYSGSAVFAQSSNTEMLPVYLYHWFYFSSLYLSFSLLLLWISPLMHARYSAISQEQNLFYILLINKDPVNSYIASMNITGVTLSDPARMYLFFLFFFFFQILVFRFYSFLLLYLK